MNNESPLRYNKDISLSMVCTPKTQIKITMTFTKKSDNLLLYILCTHKINKYWICEIFVLFLSLLNVGSSCLFINMRRCLTNRHTSLINRYNLPNKPTQLFTNNITNSGYILPKNFSRVLTIFMIFVLCMSFRENIDNLS